MTDPRVLLNDIEATLAHDDDRSVEEFRDRHPYSVLAVDALRAVLDQHGAVTSLGRTFCWACDQSQGWPCPTVQAITTALEAK